MFSTSIFYEVIFKQLISKICVDAHCMSFAHFYSPKSSDVCCILEELTPVTEKYRPVIFFHDQEPFYIETFNNIFEYSFDKKFGTQSDNINLDIPGWNGVTMNSFLHDIDSFKHHFLVFANSEKSEELVSNCKDRMLYNWYYFRHGFIALDWYRNTKYLPANYKFDKVFITFNNIVSGNRNYRLTLVSKLLEKQLHSFGHISLNNDNLQTKIKNEIFSKSLLSVDAKKNIFKYLFNTNLNFTIDSANINGNLSAFDNLDVYTKGFIHVVTETIFYENKLHLTEKIFKPIVARRPFILVGATGNLKYLKSYGFKTFDKWIDESYDNEADPDKRIDLIVTELEKLCKLSDTELRQIQKEMMDITEFNFNHFFNDFKKIIVDELVENFRRLVIKYNAGKDTSFAYYIDHSKVNYESIKEILTS